MKKLSLVFLLVFCLTGTVYAENAQPSLIERLQGILERTEKAYENKEFDVVFSSMEELEKLGDEINKIDPSSEEYAQAKEIITKMLATIGAAKIIEIAIEEKKNENLKSFPSEFRMPIEKGISQSLLVLKDSKDPFLFTADETLMEKWRNRTKGNNPYDYVDDEFYKIETIFLPKGREVFSPLEEVVAYHVTMEALKDTSVDLLATRPNPILILSEPLVRKNGKTEFVSVLLAFDRKQIENLVKDENIHETPVSKSLNGYYCYRLADSFEKHQENFSAYEKILRSEPKTFLEDTKGHLPFLDQNILHGKEVIGIQSKLESFPFVHLDPKLPVENQADQLNVFFSKTSRICAAEIEDSGTVVLRGTPIDEKAGEKPIDLTADHFRTLAAFVESGDELYQSLDAPYFYQFLIKDIGGLPEQQVKAEAFEMAQAIAEAFKMVGSKATALLPLELLQTDVGDILTAADAEMKQALLGDQAQFPSEVTAKARELGKAVAKYENSLCKSFLDKVKESESGIELLNALGIPSRKEWTPEDLQEAQWILSNYQRYINVKDSKYLLDKQIKDLRAAFFLNRLEIGNTYSDRTAVLKDICIKSVELQEISSKAIEEFPNEHHAYHEIPGYSSSILQGKALLQPYFKNFSGRLWFYTNLRNVLRKDKESLYLFGQYPVAVGSEPDLIGEMDEFTPEMYRSFAHVNEYWPYYCKASAVLKRANDVVQLYQVLTLLGSSNLSFHSNTELPKKRIQRYYHNIGLPYTYETQQLYTLGMSIAPATKTDAQMLISYSYYFENVQDPALKRNISDYLYVNGDVEKNRKMRASLIYQGQRRFFEFTRSADDRMKVRLLSGRPAVRLAPIGNGDFQTEKQRVLDSMSAVLNDADLRRAIELMHKMDVKTDQNAFSKDINHPFQQDIPYLQAVEQYKAKLNESKTLKDLNAYRNQLQNAFYRYEAHRMGTRVILNNASTENRKENVFQGGDTLMQGLITLNGQLADRSYEEIVNYGETQVKNGSIRIGQYELIDIRTSPSASRTMAYMVKGPDKKEYVIRVIPQKDEGHKERLETVQQNIEFFRNAGFRVPQCQQMEPGSYVATAKSPNGNLLVTAETVVPGISIDKKMPLSDKEIDEYLDLNLKFFVKGASLESSQIPKRVIESYSEKLAVWKERRDDNVSAYQVISQTDSEEAKYAATEIKEMAAQFNNNVFSMLAALTPRSDEKMPNLGYVRDPYLPNYFEKDGQLWSIDFDGDGRSTIGAAIGSVLRQFQVQNVEQPEQFQKLFDDAITKYEKKRGKKLTSVERFNIILDAIEPVYKFSGVENRDIVQRSIKEKIDLSELLTSDKTFLKNKRKNYFILKHLLALLEANLNNEEVLSNLAFIGGPKQVEEVKRLITRTRRDLQEIIDRGLLVMHPVLPENKASHFAMKRFSTKS